MNLGLGVVHNSVHSMVGPRGLLYENNTELVQSLSNVPETILSPAS